MPGSKGGKTKHDRCVEGVKRSNPNIDNPHAVCVSQGVEPSSWKKSESEEVEVLKIDSNGQWSLEKRCWDGYEPTPGKKAYEKGSCTKKGEMDGVEVGGSKDSKNTKTYDKEFEKVDENGPETGGSENDKNTRL